MDFITVSFADMNAGTIAAWVLITTAAGWAARSIVRGRKVWGLWGDLAIGLVGIYLMAVIFNLLRLDLAARMRSWLPASFAEFAIWATIALTAFLGALLIRAVMRPFTGGGGGGH